MSGHPTLVFIPGSWHKPACFSKVVGTLQNQYGLRCRDVTLPSTSGDPNATFKDDLDAAREVVAAEITAKRNVVVIAHSYGGMVGNSAIKGFAQLQLDDVNEGTTGFVIGLVLIASGFTLSGLAFMDPFFGHPPPSWRVNKETGFAELVVDPQDFFYHDVPKDEAQHWVAELTPQSLKSLFEGGENSYAGWQDVPSWYIGTIEDRGLPVVMQRIGVAMARQMGAQVEHRELQTSHSPFLSRPEETVDVILQAIEAFEGKKQVVLAKAAGTLPSPKLRQPMTWLKYGVPLLFGHLLGRGFLIYNWVRKRW